MHRLLTCMYVHTHKGMHTYAHSDRDRHALDTKIDTYSDTDTDPDTDMDTDTDTDNDTNIHIDTDTIKNTGIRTKTQHINTHKCRPTPPLPPRT